MDDLRPVPNDPGAAHVQSMVDLHGQGWVVTAEGDYETAAVEGFKRDGTGYQPLVAVTWAGRVMHSDERVQVKLLVHPDDAEGLARVLSHTVRWLRSNPGTAGAGKTQR